MPPLNNYKLEMYPKEWDAPVWKNSMQMANAWKKLKHKLLMSSQIWTEMDGQMDRDNLICPFHHSSNGGGIKIFLLQWQVSTPNIDLD